MLGKIRSDLNKVMRTLNNMRTFEAEVVENIDPEGLDRIKVKCSPLYGEGIISPWCLSKEIYTGNGIGTVNTPPIGSFVSIKLRGGNTDSPEWEGGFRNANNPPPEEFLTPEINGEKTPGSILIVKNDIDGSYQVTVPAGTEVYLDGSGILHLTGVTIISHGETKLNNGSIPIALGGPTIKCPVTGLDIPSSVTCMAKQ